MSMNKVNFVGATQALYNAVVTKDNDSLYFISDTQRIYKGAVDCTQNIYPVVNFPAAGVDNKIYIHVNTLETRIYDEGAWKVVSPGFVKTVETMKDAANGGKLATIDAIKGYIDEILDARVADLFNTVGFDATTGEIVLSGEGASSTKKVQLEGVAHDATYDATNLTITIPQYGKEDLVVNIPRDNFLTDAYYDAKYDFEDGTVGPAIVLVVKTEGSEETKKIAVPAAAMANDYTGYVGNNIEVIVKDNHQLRAKLRIDPSTSDGVLMIWDASAKHVGTVGVKINNDESSEMGNSNESIPTAAVIAAAIKKACEDVSGNLLPEGNENEVVISTAHGIIRSGMVFGGATLSSNPNAQTLATEAAVLDAISWKALA